MQGTVLSQVVRLDLMWTQGTTTYPRVLEFRIRVLALTTALQMPAANLQSFQRPPPKPPEPAI